VVIVTLRGAEDLAEKIGAALGEEVIAAEEREFPDGEVLVRVEASGDVILVARLWPNPNTSLVKLVLALDALSDVSNNIDVVVPYLPYTRQDRRFRPGEPISIRAVFKLLGNYPIRRLVTVDVHKPYIAEYSGRIRLVNLSPMAIVANRVKEMGLRDPVILSPDIGSAHRAEELAKILNATYSHLLKQRDRVTGAIRTEAPPDLDLRGRDVVIVDDILATGGTIVEACRIAKDRGASKVYAYATHCQLIGDAEEMLKGCLDGLMCSNTILCKYSVIDVSGLITRALAP